MRYRPEIDGLRSIAVLPVILFHAGFAVFPGGFAGVDVFFVISGYLITAILLEELQRGSFSLASFYERRARRIVPALAVVCITCIPLACLLMLPAELKDFSKSLYYVALMGSNILFWKETGYFSPSNDLKPLLHTWSLSVEEQFYIALPLVLMLTWRRGRTLTVVGCLVLASFASTQLLARLDPIANFYLLPSRFWELGVGSILAMAPTIKTRSKVKQLLSLAGLAMILATYLFVEESDFLPGWRTVPVVVGTGLVLAFSDSSNLVGKTLSLKPIVAVGLISYSLYLWHQPLFAFARLKLFTGVSAQVYAGLIALTFFLSAITYWFVEKPFRSKALVPRKTVFTFAALSIAMVSSLGLIGSKTAGFAGYSFIGNDVANGAFGFGTRCDGNITSSCRDDEAPELAVWGDSFARHLVDGFHASDVPMTIAQLSKTACAPILGLGQRKSGQSQDTPRECRKFNDAVVAFILKTPSIKYVVISSNVFNLSAPVLERRDGLEIAPDKDELLTEFHKTLDMVNSAGAQPVIFAPPPRTGADVGGCVARALKNGAPTELCDMDRLSADAFDAKVTSFLKNVAELYPVIDMRHALCGDATCPGMIDGVAIYENDGHLSLNGSRHLGRTLHFTSAVRDAAAGKCGTRLGRPAGICHLGNIIDR